MQIVVKQLALRVSGFRFQLLDFRTDMAIADQNVRPAVVIHVEEATAPAQVLGVRAETRGESGVFKIGTALIVIERRRVAGEVGFDQVEIAVRSEEHTSELQSPM